MANSKSKNIWIEREMILSPAFLKLNGTAKTVLLLFLYRRQWEKPGRKAKWSQANIGEILFPYAEAKKRFKISKSSFARAIDKLIQCGFIDIAHLGGGMVGDCTKYAISDRWKNYGTDEFISKFRPKDKRGFGFTAKNWEERTGRKRKGESKFGINNDSSISNKIDTEEQCFKPQPISKSIQDKTKVNFFINKGEAVLRALSCRQYQN